MYEIGDEVIYQGADKSAYKRRGVVAAIEEKDGKPQLTVAFEDGEEFTAPIDDWSRAFTNAAKNGVSPEMRMAVKLRLKQDFKDDYGSYRKGDVFQVYPYGFNPHHATLVAPGRKVTLEVPWDKVELVNSRACNSTNKTVANALNARAAKNDITPYGAVSGILALKYYEKKDDVGNRVMIVRAPKDEVEKYLRARAGSYPYKIEPYRGGNWTKVTASTTWNAAAKNATDADVERYLAAARDRIRGEIETLKDVVGLLKMKPMPPSAEKAHEKFVKAMASLQRAFAELRG